MKKTVLLSSTMLLLALVVGGNVVSADTTKETTGTVTFKENPDENERFSIKSASNFDFGEQVITTQEKDYPLVEDANINWIDLRGNYTGWTLSLTQSATGFLSTSQSELKGATIKFGTTEGQLTGYTAETSNIPETINTGFNLIPGQKQVLISAESGRGAGEWNYLLDKDLVELNVPAKTIQLKQAYTTGITWLLEDVPTP